MKGKILTILIAFALVTPAASMNGDKPKVGMDHSDHNGRLIRESNADGHFWAYHLIDNMAAMAELGDIKPQGTGRLKSYHLMVYIVDGEGKKVTEGEVGYKVTGPDGRKQRAMAEAMLAGFGADVDLKAKGVYTVRTKVVAGEKKLVDEFTYEVR